MNTPAIDRCVQAAQAACNIQKFIEWYEQQEEANSIDLVLLRRMRTYAMKKSQTEVKQKPN